MTGPEKRKIYEAVEAEFNDPTYSDQASSLTRDVIAACESWLKDNKTGIPRSAREARKDMREFVYTKIDLNDYKRHYFLPSFIWLFIAGQVISFIVKWIIENHTKAT